jgi:uncharacterized protein (TIGR00299 family) protein
MKALYYDCFAGISGDMNLAAMIDLGVDEKQLRSELDKLGISSEFELKVTRAAKSGIHGTRVDVILHDHHHHHHPEEHHHSTGHHGEDHHQHHENHEHSNHQQHKPHHHHHGRNLADITTIISNSSLSNSVKENAISIFQRIAEAEAHVHNCPINEIHFHEVGATDAIVDIVGAAICHELLGIDTIVCSTVEVGGGFVECAHGKMPVPAPATAAILHGVPTRRGTVLHETTTPTGAAIIATFATGFSDSPLMTVEKTAYGVGHRDMEIPNLLRIQLGEIEHNSATTEKAVMLECTIDDMTAEALGYALESLLEAGASDVNLIPATVKKSRPATILSVLCSTELEHQIKKQIFSTTTTLGVKSIPITKTTLDRKSDTRETSYGKVTIKQALLDGKVIRSKPEFDECAALARQHSIPLSEVYHAVTTAEQSDK